MRVRARGAPTPDRGLGASGVAITRRKLRLQHLELPCTLKLPTCGRATEAETGHGILAEIAHRGTCLWLDAAKLLQPKTRKRTALSRFGASSTCWPTKLMPPSPATLGKLWSNLAHRSPEVGHDMLKSHLWEGWRKRRRQKNEGHFKVQLRHTCLWTTLQNCSNLPFSSPDCLPPVVGAPPSLRAPPPPHPTYTARTPAQAPTPLRVHTCTQHHDMYPALARE